MVNGEYMNIKEQLQQDMKEAMRARDQHRLDVIRMALAALQSAQQTMVKQAFDAASAAGEERHVDNKQSLSDQAMLDVMSKEVKRRREAADLFRKGGRADRAEAEETEIAILEHYLPRMLTADEIRPLIAAQLSSLGARSIADISKVMPVLIKEFKGRADGRVINQVVRELLSTGDG